MLLNNSKDYSVFKDVKTERTEQTEQMEKRFTIEHGQEACCNEFHREE